MSREKLKNVKKFLIILNHLLFYWILHICYWSIYVTCFKKIKYYPDQFPCSKNQCSFVSMLVRFFIFLPVVIRKNYIIFPYRISCLYKIISEIFICSFYHSSFLCFKFTRLFFRPDQSCKFSNFVIFRKSLCISYLSYYTCREYISNTTYTTKCIRKINSSFIALSISLRVFFNALIFLTVWISTRLIESA